MKISRMVSWFRSGRVTLIMLIIVSFWLPLSKNILPVLMVLTLISFLIQKKRSFKHIDIRSEKLLFLVIAFYVIHVISLLYSSNLNKGLFDLEVKLLILIFPVIFLFIKLKDLNNLRIKMFNAFIIGNVIASLICIILAFYNSVKNGNGELINISLWTATRDWSVWKLLVTGYSYFNYTWLSYFHHPSYFGMYFVFAAYLAYYFLRKSFKQFSKYVTSFYIFAMVLFAIMLFLLQSRAVTLTTAIIILFELSRIIFVSKTGIIFKTTITFLTIGLIFVFTLSNERFGINKTANMDTAGITIKESNIRIEIWQKSAEIIQENLLFGVGNGDVKSELNSKYNTPFLEIAKEKGYNAHNQFIETAIGIGLIGLLVLNVILFLPFFEKRNFDDIPVIIIFLLILITGFIFESMLNTIAGVSFFGLFYSLLNRSEIDKIRKN